MQIVVFKLGDEHFAVETERVQGINDIMGITKVPKAPAYIKGLINLRGNIKSLVDIDLLLDVNSSDVFLSFLPLHHVFECTVGFLFSLYKDQLLNVNSFFEKN